MLKLSLGKVIVWRLGLGCWGVTLGNLVLCNGFKTCLPFVDQLSRKVTILGGPYYVYEIDANPTNLSTRASAYFSGKLNLCKVSCVLVSVIPASGLHLAI